MCSTAICSIVVCSVESKEMKLGRNLLNVFIVIRRINSILKHENNDIATEAVLMS
jgi:hypothetical protein